MGSEEVKCAVCGTAMLYDDAYGSAEHGRETYHVCCKACMESFRQQPEKYSA